MSSCPSCQREVPLLWTRHGKRCSECAGGSVLEPSRRQMKRFSWGFAGASAAQFVFLPLLPGMMLVSLFWAVWYRVEGALRMLPGIAGIFLFWVWLMPPLLEEAPAGSVLVAMLFATVLLFLLGPPFLQVSRGLLLRGRGVVAGAVLSSLLLASIFSFAAPLVLLIADR